MARYCGPVCRLCRREGKKLFLKGERCYTQKCGVERREYPPGQHGQGQVRRKVSSYGIQLREKQKLRRIYGLLEKQFRSYFYDAARKKGVTGENLLSILESRLDNVIYRLGLGLSRAQARQLITHGCFAVNGRFVNIPSYRLKPKDCITVCDKKKEMVLLKSNSENAKSKSIPTWLSFDPDKMEASIVTLPSRDDIGHDVKEQLVVEFYSR